MSNLCFYVDFWASFSEAPFLEQKWSPFWRADIQSDHASACFVRVGRCRLGSILGSILESFWEPSSLLYSFSVARVAETGSQQRVTKTKDKISCELENRAAG